MQGSISKGDLIGVGVSYYAGADGVVGMVEDSVVAGLNRSILTGST